MPHLKQTGAGGTVVEREKYCRDSSNLTPRDCKILWWPEGLATPVCPVSSMTS